MNGLQTQCEQIANTINNGLVLTLEGIEDIDDGDMCEEGDMLSGWDYIQEAYNFRWVVDAKDNVLECQIMVAGGGPEIWVHVFDDGTGRVEGYWWGDRATARISNDAMDIFAAAEEFYLTKG